MRATLRDEIIPIGAEEGAIFGNIEKNSAEAAIDRNLLSFTRISKDSATGSVWMKFWLDKSYFISKVIIYDRFFVDWYSPNNTCAKNEDNYASCLKNRDGVAVTVGLNSCGSLQMMVNRLEQADQIYTLLCNAEGRTVLLTSADEKTLSIRDIAVIGHSAGKLN